MSQAELRSGACINCRDMVRFGGPGRRKKACILRRRASPGTSATTTSVLFAGLHPIYLLFGIAMITMCFNLVQVEVINSVKGVGKMLGIIKDSEDDEDY